MAHQHPGLEQHADRDEEQRRERVLQRLQIVRSAMTESGATDHHAGK
jgi:hypothetical protein